jgi:hypothetical protein
MTYDCTVPYRTVFTGTGREGGVAEEVYCQCIAAPVYSNFWLRVFQNPDDPER